jgi:hypothetical protein
MRPPLSAGSLPVVCVLVAVLSACDTDSESTTSSSPTVAGSAIVTTPARGDSPSLNSVPSEDVECISSGISNGLLTLKAGAVRVSGISPLLVFFDATGTTDSSISGGASAFQDVHYAWSFGDSGASGKGTWMYGANPGKNSRNSATGGVAAHLYVTSGADTVYTATVTAYDGRNKSSCHLGVTVYDPSGAKGFPGRRTTCVASSGKPTPGSGGCPIGARALKTASFNEALSSSSLDSRKRVLFKCGDAFVGDGATLSGTSWSVGAYGGCEGSQENRPVLRESGTGGHLTVALDAGDGRIADLDFEGNGTAASAIGTPGSISRIPYQITLYNLLSNGNDSSYSWSQGAQWGIVDSVMTAMRTSIGVFVNYNENNPATWGGNVYNNLDYQALLGSKFDGAGGTSGNSGQETVRISACRMCVIENNTIVNANNIGATLKLHNGNTNNSSETWTGVYTELMEISDNWFGGTSGAQYVETAPQNGGLDERLRNIVVERNLFSGSTGAEGGRQLMVSAVNETVRNNVFYMPGSPAKYAILGVQVAARGIEQVPSGIEVYNNTCYAPPGGSNQICVGFNTIGSMHVPPTNSVAKNNLFYVAGSHATVDNAGSNNTVSNNTVTTSGDPGFTNGSGSFSVISDFKPTANYAGGVAVAVWADALGVPWSPTWDLGALHH